MRETGKNLSKDSNKDLRRVILDASIQLVAESGVRAVSFREVARIANVSHQAPYHYFENHLAIMRAIAQEGFAGLATAMKEAADEQEGDSLAALTAAGIAYVLFAVAHLGHFRVMFQQSLVDIHDPEAPLGESEGAFGVLMTLSTRVHEDGYGKGLTRDRIAMICWSVVHGIASLIAEGIVETKKDKISIQVSEITDQVVCGLSLLLDPKGQSKGIKKKRRTT